jgi:CRISPR-associated protein Csd1
MNPLRMLYDYAISHSLEKDAFFEENEVEFLLRVKDDLSWDLGRLHGPRKGRGMPMHLPIPLKRTVNVMPNFPADNPLYVLGVDLDIENPMDPEKVEERHQAYVAMIARAAKETGDKALLFVLRVLEKLAVDPKKLTQMGMGAGDTICPAVMENGSWQAVALREPVREWWRKNYGALQKMEGAVMKCMVTGKELPAARLHPLVTGMKGGRSTGITLVTCNEDSLESWGRSQGENFPVSVEAAVLISKALSRIVSRKSGKRRSMMLPGNTYMCFVAKREAEERAAEFIMSLLDPVEEDLEAGPAGFAKREVKIWKAHKALFRAPYRADLVPPPETPMGIILARPNGARIEIRGCMEYPFDRVYGNLKTWFEDLEIFDPYDKAVRSDFTLRNVWGKDPATGKPRRLLGGLMDALKNEKNGEYPRFEVLTGTYMAAIENGPLPQEILRLAMEQVTRKSHDSEYGAVPVPVAALLKAFLTREARRPASTLVARWNFYDPEMKGISAMLDLTCRHPAYVNGRVIAVAERVQEIAIPGVVGGVVKRCFDAASKSPGSMMPSVITNLNHHMAKIFRAKPGLGVWCQKLVGEVMGLLPADREKAFPKNLDRQDQALFALGYFHQRSDLFTKKEKTETGKDPVPAPEAAVV